MFRTSLRALVARRAFALGVIVTLALGFGVNVALFTVIRTVIIQPLRVSAPEQLVSIYTATTQSQYRTNIYPLYRALATSTGALSGVAASISQTLQWTDHDSADVDAVAVSPTYFSVLGVRPAVGRLPGSADTVADQAMVVALSHAFWTRQFAGNRSVLGRAITLNGQRLTVVGVLPPTFRGTDLGAIPDVWIPLNALIPMKPPMLVVDGKISELMPFVAIIGRILPTNRARAEMELQRIGHAVAEQSAWIDASPIVMRAPVTVVPLQGALAPTRDRGGMIRVLNLLALGAAITLLIACTNVATLLVVRSRERARELGVRLAIGARQRDVVGLVLTETLLLSLAAGLVGIGVGMLTLRLFASFRLPGNVILDRLDLRADPALLLFSLGLSIVTALAVVLPAVLHTLRLDPLDSVLDRCPREHRRYRMGLIPIQVALSTVALITTGLLLQTIRSALTADPGFNMRGVAVMKIGSPSRSGYANRLVRYESIIGELERDPSIKAAAAASWVPVADFRNRFDVGPGDVGPGPTRPVRTTGELRMGGAYVTSNYFRVLGIPVVEGRPFGPQDRVGTEQVVILNQSAARALFPGVSAIGQMLHATSIVSFSYRVVGVVRDTRYVSLQDQSVPVIFKAFAQEEPLGLGGPLILARSASPTAALAVIRRTVSRVDPTLILRNDPPASSGLANARLLSSQLLALVAPQRLIATLLGALAALAVCVSAVGIYGNVAYRVDRQTTEIGIRMALGAVHQDIIVLFLKDVGLAIGIGLAAGYGGAMLTTPVIRRYLYDQGAGANVMAFIAAALVVFVVSSLAAMVPTWRGLHVDPARSVRYTG